MELSLSKWRLFSLLNFILFNAGVGIVHIIFLAFTVFIFPLKEYDIENKLFFFEILITFDWLLICCFKISHILIIKSFRPF